MSRQVILSKTATKKLDKLSIYLELNWSEKVKLGFISKLEERLHIIKQKPEAFPKSEIKKGLYKCVITKQTTLYSTFDEQSIFILTLFEYRQNPEALINDLG